MRTAIINCIYFLQKFSHIAEAIIISVKMLKLSKQEIVNSQVTLDHQIILLMNMP